MFLALASTGEVYSVLSLYHEEEDDDGSGGEENGDQEVEEGKLGGGWRFARDIFLLQGETEFTDLKVPRLYPLVLLVNVESFMHHRSYR